MNIRKRTYLIQAYINELTSKRFTGNNYSPEEFKAKEIKEKEKICTELHISMSTLNRDINSTDVITHTRLLAYATYFKCEVSKLLKTDQPSLVK